MAIGSPTLDLVQLQYLLQKKVPAAHLTEDVVAAKHLAALALQTPKPGFEALAVGTGEVMKCFNTAGKLISPLFKLNQTLKVFLKGYRTAKDSPVFAAEAEKAVTALKTFYPQIEQLAAWQAQILGNSAAQKTVLEPDQSRKSEGGIIIVSAD